MAQVDLAGCAVASSTEGTQIPAATVGCPEHGHETGAAVSRKGDTDTPWEVIAAVPLSCPVRKLSVVGVGEKVDPGMSSKSGFSRPNTTALGIPASICETISQQ